MAVYLRLLQLSKIVKFSELTDWRILFDGISISFMFFLFNFHFMAFEIMVITTCQSSVVLGQIEEVFFFWNDCGKAPEVPGNTQLLDQVTANQYVLKLKHTSLSILNYIVYFLCLLTLSVLFSKTICQTLLQRERVTVVLGYYVVQT